MKLFQKNMAPYFALFIVVHLWCVASCAQREVNFIEHSQTMRIPLHRQKPVWKQQMNSPMHKHGVTMDLNRSKSDVRTNDSVVLYRYLDNEFYGQIVIGHPGQTMNVAFDASWIYTWLMSSECNDDRPNATGCVGHNLYNHRHSSEYIPDGTKIKCSDDLSGYYSYENISIAHSNVTGYHFIEMTEVPDSLAINKADGVMGLGLKVTDYEPFFYTLVKQNKIRDPVFSIYINRNRQSKNNKGGNLLLGFYDQKHIKVDVIDGNKVRDEILYLSVDALSYWQFKMDKVMMIFNKNENQTFCADGCKAVIDSSSTIITGPKEDITKINKNIEAREIIIQNQKRYAVDCDSVNGLPKMNFVFQDKVFTFSGPKYIVKVTDGFSSICMSAFQYADSYDETPRWMLGTTFLAEVYTIYDVDKKEIGLVRAA